MLKAVVPKGSLAHTTFPHPADLHRTGRDHSSTNDEPARVTERSLGAPLASMFLDKQIQTLENFGVTSFSGRYYRATHHRDHFCSCPDQWISRV